MSTRNWIYLAAGIAAVTSLGVGAALACTPMDVSGAECISVGEGRVVTIEGSDIRELPFTNRCEQDVLVSYEWAGDFQSRKLIPAGLDALIRCNAARCTGEIEWGAVCDGKTVPGKVATLSVSGPAIPFEETASAEAEKAKADAAAVKAKAAAEKKAKAKATAEKKAKAEAAAKAEAQKKTAETETATPIDNLLKPIQEAATSTEGAAKPPSSVPVAPLLPTLKPAKKPVTESVAPPMATIAEEPTATEAEPPVAEMEPAVPEKKVAMAAPEPTEIDIPTQMIDRQIVSDGAPPQGYDADALDKLLIGRWNTAGTADLECEVQSTTGTVSVKARQAPYYYTGNAVVKTSVDVKDGCQLKLGVKPKWTYESDISLTVRGDRVQITWHKVTDANPGGVSTYMLKDGKLIAEGERQVTGGAFEEVLTKR